MKQQEKVTREFAKEVIISSGIKWSDRNEIETLQSDEWKLVVSKVVGREISEFYQVGVSGEDGDETYILEPIGLNEDESIRYQAFVDVCEAQYLD